MLYRVVLAVRLRCGSNCAVAERVWSAWWAPFACLAVCPRMSLKQPLGLVLPDGCVHLSGPGVNAAAQVNDILKAT